MLNYIDTYRELIPEMNEFQLRQQKKMFERNYCQAGNNWHPVDKVIHTMIVSRLELIHVFNSVN